MQQSYLKEFSPKKITFHWRFVSLCVSQCLMFVCPAENSVAETQTDVAVTFPKDVDPLHSVTTFLFPSQTSQCLLQYLKLAFCCTEMCIPNTTKAVVSFLYADYFHFHFSCILLNLVTVRCTYLGVLYGEGTLLSLTVGKKK